MNYTKKEIYSFWPILKRRVDEPKEHIKYAFRDDYGNRHDVTPGQWYRSDLPDVTKDETYGLLFERACEKASVAKRCNWAVSRKNDKRELSYKQLLSEFEKFN